MWWLVGLCHNAIFIYWIKCLNFFTFLENTDARYVSVNCQKSNWYIKIRLPPLKKKYADFKDSDIYLGSDSCTGYRSGDYLVFNEEYTTCETNKTVSMNSIERNNGRETSKWAFISWREVSLAEMMMLICFVLNQPTELNYKMQLLEATIERWTCHLTMYFFYR